MLPLFLLACAQGSSFPTFRRLVIWWVMETFAGSRTRASVYGHFVVLLPSAARKLCPIKVEVCASVSVSASNCSRKRLMANGNYNLRQRAAKNSSAASWATCRSSTQVSIRCTSLCLYGENLPAHVFPFHLSLPASPAFFLCPWSRFQLQVQLQPSASRALWSVVDVMMKQLAAFRLLQFANVARRAMWAWLWTYILSWLASACLGLLNLLNYSNADTVAYE